MKLNKHTSIRISQKAYDNICFFAEKNNRSFSWAINEIALKIKDNNKKIYKKNDDHLLQKSKDVFINYYKYIQLPYVWKKSDTNALKTIINTIKGQLKQNATDENVINTIRFMLKNLPEWYVKNNCSVTVINKNYNGIVNQIKNGNSKEATESRVEQLMQRYNSEKG